MSQWAWRDDFQQKLVRQARRLPYEAPAFAAAERITKPLFGSPEEEGPKRRWYDPARGVDFAKDIAKAAGLQFGGFMLPGAVLGASKGSSLNFYNTMTSTKFAGLGNTRQDIYKNSLNLKGALQEVGHDALDIFEKSVKFGERSSGGLAAAFLGLKDINFNPVGELYRRRHGASPLRGQARRKDVIQNLAKDIFKGDKAVLNQSVEDHAKINTLLDLIPGYKSVRQGFDQGYKQYKSLGFAQQYIDSPGTSFNKSLAGIAKGLGIEAKDGVYGPEATDALSKSVKNIQTKRTSKLYESLRGVEKEISNSPYGSFQKMLRGQAYKNILEEKLVVDFGFDRNTVNTFMKNLSVTDDVYRDTTITEVNRDGKRVARQIQQYITPSERLSVSTPKIVGENFFEELTSRYNLGKIGKANPLPKDFHTALERTIHETDLSKTFQSGNIHNTNKKLLKGRIGPSGKIAKKIRETQIGETTLGSRKLLLSDYLAQAEGNSKQANILRATMAQRAGKIIGLPDSVIGDNQNLVRELARRGLNADSPEQLRAYLLSNKAMSRSGNSGIAGFFGLKGLSLDDHIKREQLLHNNLKSTIGEEGLRDANIIYQGDPDGVFSSLQRIRSDLGQQSNISTVKGYFDYGNGKVINLNPLRTGKDKFLKFLSEELRTPIVGINPLQLLGFKDFSAMSEAGSFQVTPGAAGHPFLGRRTSRFL